MIHGILVEMTSIVLLSVTLLCNILPECVFHSGEHELRISVSQFQSNLNVLLKSVSNDLDGWASLFCSSTTISDHLLCSFSNLGNFVAYQ